MKKIAVGLFLGFVYIALPDGALASQVVPTKAQVKIEASK